MGKLIPLFPGADVDLGERMKPPTSLDARRFVRLFDQVREIERQTPATAKLTEDELVDARIMGIHICERCNARVVARASEWWNATDGRLHASTCERAV